MGRALRRATGSLGGLSLILSIAAMAAGSAFGVAAAAGPVLPGRIDVSHDEVHLHVPGWPIFDDAFWKYWGDGQAEVAGYALQFSRYGAVRSGTAVTVFVTETFSNSLRVKSDPGRHPATDEFPVMKLNLVQDFATGIYDYNLMISAFSALTPVNGLPAGGLTKVSFSAQEWCGHAYSQALLAPDSVRVTGHSYFDGEADERLGLPLPAGGLAEDALLLWARGFAGPALAPGQSVTVPLLGSLKVARLVHRRLDLDTVRLARAGAPTRVTVPAGTFAVERFTAALGAGRTWEIDVEQAAPRRIIRWSRTDPGPDGGRLPGETGELLAATRLKYWEMHDPGFEKELGRLGLAPRPPRTP